MRGLSILHMMDGWITWMDNNIIPPAGEGE
jgi:hypothetical protein